MTELPGCGLNDMLHDQFPAEKLNFFYDLMYMQTNPNFVHY